jgi:hypothetical protein
MGLPFNCYYLHNVLLFSRKQACPDIFFFDKQTGHFSTKTNSKSAKSFSNETVVNKKANRNERLIQKMLDISISFQTQNSIRQQASKRKTIV